MGFHLSRYLADKGYKITIVDKMTSEYCHARSLELKGVCIYEHDICHEISDYMENVDIVVNMAAESFVDKSIKFPKKFIDSNIYGTHMMLMRAKDFKTKLFIQVSTDEVYGEAAGGRYFTELDRLCPGNPYSASKAAADQLCLAYHRTFGIPVIIVRPENNYGTHQAGEKAIPTWINSLLNHAMIPIYGDGKHRRMWLHVEDFCSGILGIIYEGEIGEIYNIGSCQEYENIEIVDMIRKEFNNPLHPIDNIPDEAARPGHDRRYAMNTEKISEFWKATKDLKFELPKVIQWHKHHPDWMRMK